jgi:16S rRNA (uracil1498-N3)-methyltransferase
MRSRAESPPSREERYFYFDEESLREGEVLFSLEESHHLQKSLRMDIGEEIVASNGKGSLFRVRITSIEKRIRGRVIEERQVAPEHCEIALAVGLVRSERMKWTVEKATELGVGEIIPLLTRHARKLHAERQRRMLVDRLHRVAVSAMKQSKRAFLPALPLPLAFDEVLAGLREGPLRLFLDEQVEHPTITDILRQYSSRRQFVIVIGPEGGFEESERGDALAHGFLQAGLGGARLRVETAAVAAICAVRSLTGMW